MKLDSRFLLLTLLCFAASLPAPDGAAQEKSPGSKTVSEKSEMLYRRGLAAYQAADFSAAESFFEQTLQEHYSPDAAVYLTYIRKETGDFAGALESLQAYLDNTGNNDAELQSYISLKLFLEARLAAQENERRLSSSRTTSLASIVIAILALTVSVISLRKKKS